MGNERKLLILIEVNLSKQINTQSSSFLWWHFTMQRIGWGVIGLTDYFIWTFYLKHSADITEYFLPRLSCGGARNVEQDREREGSWRLSLDTPQSQRGGGGLRHFCFCVIIFILAQYHHPPDKSWFLAGGLWDGHHGLWNWDEPQPTSENEKSSDAKW